jgi:2-haloalkanoic acid dehalogenase type II
MIRHRAILLDFYGTVVEEDDLPIVNICEEIARVSTKNITAKEVGLYWASVFSEMCLKSHGNTFRSQRELENLSLQKVLLNFDAALDSEGLSQILYEYWTHPKIFPESKMVIAKCDVPICLVSNIDNGDLASALRHNKLSFDLIVTSEDCKAYKPRSELFEKAVSLLGMSNEEVLHVGDSLSSDVQGAKMQGISILWINRKGRKLSPQYEQPDYISTDLAGILDILGYD